MNNLNQATMRFFTRLIGMKRLTKFMWHRWIAHGADYSDVEETMSRIKGISSWCPEWSRTAERYEVLAAAQEHEGGTAVSAKDYYLKAAAYYYLAQWILFAASPEKKEAYLKSKVCYDLASRYFEVPVQRVRVPFENNLLPGYLRIPSHAKSEKLPAVLLVHGMDSAKEELYWTEQPILRRGLATLTIDGPGQGESYICKGLLWPTDFERALSSAIDFLSEQPEIDASRIGVCGISWGGHWALKLACNERRLVACAAVGPTPDMYRFDKLPAPIRLRYAELFGASTTAEAGVLLKSPGFDLATQIQKLTCPVHIVHGKLDPLVPYPGVEKLVALIRAPKEFTVFEDGDHCCTQHIAEVRALVADWLASRLGHTSVERTGEQQRSEFQELYDSTLERTA